MTEQQMYTNEPSKHTNKQTEGKQIDEDDLTNRMEEKNKIMYVILQTDEQINRANNYRGYRC